VGHFFGLSHSMAKGASMNPEYRVNLMDTSFRTLSKDDEKGICALYLPAAKDVTDCTGEGPRNGFSRYCEATSDEANAAWFCSMLQRPAAPHSLLFGGLSLLGLAAAVGARRRR
jgi:Matrixin